jgi:hypothetical protein
MLMRQAIRRLEAPHVTDRTSCGTLSILLNHDFSCFDHCGHIVPFFGLNSSVLRFVITDSTRCHQPCP